MPSGLQGQHYNNRPDSESVGFETRLYDYNLIEAQRFERAKELQRNMDEHIVSALPGAFSLIQSSSDSGRARNKARNQPIKSAARSEPILIDVGRPKTSRFNKARSMRQHRSGYLGAGPFLVVPKRTKSEKLGAAGSELVVSSTTSAVNQMIQDQQQQQHHKTTTTSKITSGDGKDEASPIMQCNMRQFSFTATKTDESGNKCSGLITANICYGACDTGEIADWLFPGKKSIHKVCRHGGRVRRRAILTSCTSDSMDEADPLREYHYVDALNCVCKRCTSVDTTCLGTMSQPSLQTLGGDTQPEAAETSAGGD